MDYDFSVLCNDQIEVLGKRLQSLHKKFITQYIDVLNVLNRPIEMENRKETKVVIEDMLNDTCMKAEIIYVECLNKIQRELKKHL